MNQFGLWTLDADIGYQIGSPLMIKALKKGYALPCFVKSWVSALIINDLLSGI